jgi:SAM-dependent methyltransferase
MMMFRTEKKDNFKKQIESTYTRYLECPLCNNKSIYKKGNINYPAHAHYSSDREVDFALTTELWQCSNCKSAFVQNILPEEESIKLYTEDIGHQTGWIEDSFEIQKHEVVINTLDNLLDKGMRVLDIGCSTGKFLDFAKQKGCITFGVEYSKTCLDLLKINGHIGYSILKEVDGSFDLITGFDLIEHIYNVPDFLNICLSKLAPGGYIAFLTGDISCFPAKFTSANWWYVRFPQHIVFPSLNYFKLHPQIKVVNWLPTYASAKHHRDQLLGLKSFVKELAQFNLTAENWTIPDHTLIILKKNDDL